MSVTSSSKAAPAFENTLKDYVGQSGAPRVSNDAVNAAMIRQWCIALGDLNPDYLNSDDPVAPPAMMQAWTMPDFGADPAEPDVIDRLYDLLNANGFTSIVATNSEQDYLKSLRIGDRVGSVKTIEAISGRKVTGLGEGYFITSIITFTNQRGETVGRQLHRVLKFRPSQSDDETPAIPRPLPNITQDTERFWQAARRHELVVQKCTSCGTLQHPPTAACGTCAALDLVDARMSGLGSLFSYTIVHAPIVAPFKGPYAVALVELDEGPRLVSDLPDLPLDQIRIGMKLKVDFVDLNDTVALPVFRSAEET